MKKKMLIWWTSRTFIELFEPLILGLSKNFYIVVLLLDYSTPSGMHEKLEFWKKEGLIERFSLSPPYRDKTRLYLHMREEIKILKAYDFDVWLTNSVVHVFERCILECALSKHCITIVFWPSITYLFAFNQKLAKKILAGTDIVQGFDSKIKTTLFNNKKSKKHIILSSLRRMLSKIITCATRGHIILMNKLSPMWRIFYDRVILSWLIFGKVFLRGPYDDITQLDSGRADAIIFCDELETEVHKLFLKREDIYTVEYPTLGSCHCVAANKTKDKAVLSPLSGFFGLDKIPEILLPLFYRDFKLVLSKTGANILHLRAHPDSKGNWPNQLKEYLVERGINAVVVDNNRPIREVCCNYLAVAGISSNSLRDARASCNHVLVIGFKSVPNAYKDPQFVFAKSEGIDWIEEDGSYDPSIFIQRKYLQGKKRNLLETIDMILEKAQK
ncbi:MAG: hypothetical protein FD145_63 [Candidatus Saganbacteria bacterium]|uniref:Uncharacterized protein n=1 Tax=Candidatus Saganbacteria bacterium TaxID=2575572 RepID=A0A833P0J1_UNCSA|nr:MAG: hypothetical protein FD145_63 [Candidatus Saganbacteria bacterium]